MRNQNTSKLLIASLLSIVSLVTSVGHAADTSKQIDSLGGNQALVDMATSMDTNNRTRIVQKRIVDRHNELELGLNYGAVAGGDSYMQTQDFGASMDYHITPRWSLGVRYYDYGNSLTPEGQRVFDKAREDYKTTGSNYQIPDIDYPLRSAMAVVDWYPIYGKTNLLDYGIAQFDMYLLAGDGQIQLSSGWTNIATAGMGMAFWLSRHFSARAEVRYQNYHDQIITGPRTINSFTGSVGIGFML